MIIHSIHLHPFAGTLDQKYSFDNKLNVLLGHNEFGKSTMTKALWHALFTRSDVKARAATAAGLVNIYPSPNGDFAHVTLEFSAGGKKWTLEKRWGTNSFSKLVAKGTAPIGDPASIQEQLEELLVFNEATWKKVLHTEQASLLTTLKELASTDTKNELSILQQLLSGTKDMPGDLPPDLIRTTLKEKIDEQYESWNQDKDEPKKGLSPTNRAKRDVGPVLATFHTMQDLEIALNQARTYEQEIDRLNARLVQLEHERDSILPELEQLDSELPLIAKRQTCLSNIKAIEEQLKSLQDVASKWRQALSELPYKEQQQVALATEINDLREEQTRARNRSTYVQADADLRQIEAINAEINEHRTTAEGITAPSAEEFAELRSMRERLRTINATLQASQLEVELVSTSTTQQTVTLPNATDEQQLTLQPQQRWIGNASGRLEIITPDLTIRVQNAGENINELYEQRNTMEARTASILKQYNHATIDDANEAATKLAQLQQMIRSLEQRVADKLNGRTIDELQQDAHKLQSMGSTRDADEIDRKISEKQKSDGAVGAQVTALHASLRTWEQTFQSLDKLEELVIDNKATLRESVKELEELPMPTIAEPDVDVLTARQKHMRGRCDELRIEIAQSRGTLDERQRNTPERTVDEITIDLDIARRKHQHEKDKGASLVRILDTLERIVARRGQADPFEELTGKIGQIFKDLTQGRYKSISLDNLAPSTVSGGKQEFDQQHLSQGARSSLALATRIALASVYMKDLDGFVLMDDPFVDLDPDRRALAMKTIAKHLSGTQIILTTCHPNHAEELKKHAKATEVVSV